jgi:urease accessory protein
MEFTTDLQHQLIETPTAFRAFEGQPAGLSVGSPGKDAVIDLTFEKFGEKTYLTNHYDKMPAKVLRPLYYDPELPGVPYMLLMNPSGGSLQGDRYSYFFRLGRSAHAFLTDTEATKIYKMDGNYAQRITLISLRQDAILEYISREVIAYEKSRWYQCTLFNVEGGSKFFFTEIFCPGRIAMKNEFWDFDIFASKLLIETATDKKPILYDSLLFDGRDKKTKDTIFGRKSFLLSAYWFSGSALRERDSIWNLLENTIDSGITPFTFGGVTAMPFDGGLVVKALSDELENLKKMQLDLWKLFRKTECGTGVPDLRMY